MNNSINNQTQSLPTTKLILHPERWFKNRIGTVIQKITTFEILKVTIMSEQHAKAMFISQREKKIKYSEI